MKYLFLLALCPLTALADYDSQPPSEVRVEEVYTPEQRAQETLKLMEQSMQQMIELRRAHGAAAKEQPAWQEAEKLWQSLVKHASADPDMHAAVHAILEKDTALQERLKNMQSELNALNSAAEND